MKIIFLTYVRNPTYRKPEEWLARISPSLPIMEQLTHYGEVLNIHSIGYCGCVKSGNIEHHFFRLNRLGAAIPVSLHWFVRKLCPDAVIVRGLIFPLQIILLRWQLGRGVAIFAQHHAEQPSQGYKKFLQRMADEFIAKYFFSSKELAKKWVDEGHIKDLSKVVEAMVMSSTFSVIGKPEARAVTGVTGDKAYLWLGDLDKNKDPFTLVNAFMQFALQYPGGKLYLIFQEDHLLGEIQAIVRDNRQIELVGKVKHDDLLYWYNSVDFIVSTSFYEGGGTAVCEGLSCGCVPIVSDIPSFRWMTLRGSIGFLFEPGNPDALFAALLASIATDLAEERRKVLKHYKAILSPEANARKMYDVIETITGKI